jgi:hypothetical protein
MAAVARAERDMSVDAGGETRGKGINVGRTLHVRKRVRTPASVSFHATFPLTDGGNSTVDTTNEESTACVQP